MIKAMGEVGQRFQDGKAFVPQLLMAGRAMKGALELLKPLLPGSASTTIGKIVIGTVKGDLHDIGKNLVASMLEGCGFEVIKYWYRCILRQICGRCEEKPCRHLVHERIADNNHDVYARGYSGIGRSRYSSSGKSNDRRSSRKSGIC